MKAGSFCRTDSFLNGKSIKTDRQFHSQIHHPVFTTRHSHPPERADYQIKYVRQPESAPLVGTDKASTGYTWSDVLQKTSGFWDRTKNSSTDSQATQAGFLVFATDSSKVEVFLPDTKVILDRRVRPDGIAVWNVEDDDTYQVQACADSWIVSRRGRLLYNTYGTDKK